MEIQFRIRGHIMHNFQHGSTFISPHGIAEYGYISRQITACDSGSEVVNAIRDNADLHTGTPVAIC